VIIAILLAALQAGSASSAVQGAQDRVRKGLHAWFKAEGPARTKAREQARAAVGELIDFDTLARSTLGKKWDELSPKDRARYAAALRGAMEANYLAKMRQGTTGDAEKVKSEVLSEEKQGDRVLVKTRVTSGQESAAIDYVMEKQKKGWRAVDVITEGVSLAETYRDQVSRLMAKKNFDAVVSALERKRKSLEAEEEKPAAPEAKAAASAPQ
jgi:phospholipid transport system substrate-binding protein